MEWTFDMVYENAFWLEINTVISVGNHHTSKCGSTELDAATLGVSMALVYNMQPHNSSIFNHSKNDEFYHKTFAVITRNTYQTDQNTFALPIQRVNQMPFNQTRREGLPLNWFLQALLQLVWLLSYFLADENQPMKAWKKSIHIMLE
jgi:hypothetical protein